MTTRGPSTPRRAPGDVDLALARLAEAQLGLVTTAQVLALGFGRHVIDHRLRVGTLEPVLRGVMRLRSSEATGPQQILAHALAVPGSAVTGVSAAVIHGLPTPPRRGPGDGKVVLLVGRGREPEVAGVSIIRLPPGVRSLPTRRWFAARVTTPAVSIVLAARHLPPETVERWIDHALAHRSATMSQVRAAMARFPSRTLPGRRSLEVALAARGSGRARFRSLNERVVRSWISRAGLPPGIPNHVVEVPGDPIGVEVDVAWPSARVGLEISPFHTHGSRAAQERDAERRRKLALARWTVIEATDPDLVDERAFRRIVGALRTLLDGA
jgi:hypothetical protein